MCNDKESEHEEFETQNHCDFCRESSFSYDGPSNSEVYMNCSCPHFCTNRINDFFDYEIGLCPVCHFLFAKWLYTLYG
jgi:hypothetical protein